MKRSEVTSGNLAPPVLMGGGFMALPPHWPGNHGLLIRVLAFWLWEGMRTWYFGHSSVVFFESSILSLCVLCWHTPSRDVLPTTVLRPPHALVLVSWFFSKCNYISFPGCTFSIVSRTTLAFSFLSFGRLLGRYLHEKWPIERLQRLDVPVELMIYFLLMSLP